MNRLSAAFHLAFFPLFFQSAPAGAEFLPEESLRNPAPAVGASDTSETEFHSVIRGIQDAYADSVKAKGGTLSIRGDWRSDKLNAGATQVGSSWQVVITGALARRPELTADGMALILCHELGHHLAGFPFAAAGNPFQKAWAANEGQSDYFSTQVCARKIWAGEREKNAAFRESTPDYVRERCDTAWGEQGQRDLCYRVSAAVKSMTDTMAGILGKPRPEFSTPDPAVVPKTSDAHPAIQCRMDTVFQGAICPAEFGEDLIPGKGVREGIHSPEAERESALRTCTAHSGHVFGLRPLCWFKPRM